jgi:hypothetical protein
MVGAASAERNNNQDPLVAFHETLQASYADPANVADSLAAQQARFSAVIEAAHAQSFDEPTQTLIDHYATVVDYLWFKGQCDSLPAAVGFFSSGSTRNEGWGDVALKGSVLSTSTFDAITATLLPLGLGDLLLERLGYAAQNKPRVDQTFKNLVDATPGAQWLEAFKVETPRVDMPLTATQRVPFEATIRDDEQRRSGPHPAMPSRPHPGSHSSINRRERGLDNVTQPRPQYRNDELAIQGLKSYVRAGLSRRINSDAPVRHEEFNIDDATLTQFTTGGREIDAYDLVEVAGDIASENNLPAGATHKLDELSREFFFEAFIRAFEQGTTHQAVYEHALAYARREFLDKATGGFNLTDGYGVSTALMATKQAPPDQEFDHWRERRDNEGLPSPGNVLHITHGTAEESKRLRRIKIGTVEKYDNPIPDVPRLLQQGTRTEALPLKVEDSAADLIITLDNFRGNPHVPGYQLIAADHLKNRYYFAYLPDDDPYKPNTTPISETVRAELVDQYGAAQLGILARNVRRQRRLTIAKLAALSQRSSTYTLRPSSRPDFSSMLGDTIDTFKPFIEGGRLRATCAIYGTFGKVSLDHVLPHEQTYVTGGYVISGASEFITAVAHSQVAVRKPTEEGFSDEVASIIEWTPAGSIAEYIPPPGFKPVSLREPPVAPRPSFFATPSPPLTVKDRVEASRRQLLMQLGVIFAPGIADGIPPEYIYGHVRKLGAGHPIAQTLGALLRVGTALETTDELLPPQVSDLMNALGSIGFARSRDPEGHATSQHDMLESALQPVLRYV